MIGDLAGELDAALGRGVSEVVVEEEVIDFGDLAGPEHRDDRSAFAELLAGTSDKKSKPYKAARRNVERWVKGRTPVAISRQRIVGARRQQSARLAAFRKHGGLMRMLVSWYASRRPEWLPPGRWTAIRQQPMRRVVRAWSEGRHEAAADLLLGEFLRQYDSDEKMGGLADVELLELRLEPREP